MTVVPCGTILDGSESIGVGLSRSNGTLGHAVDSIHFQTLELPYAMPMNCGAIEAQFVLDSYFCSSCISKEYFRRDLMSYPKCHPSKPL